MSGIWYRIHQLKCTSGLTVRLRISGTYLDNILIHPCACKWAYGSDSGSSFIHPPPICILRAFLLHHNILPKFDF